MSAPTGSQWHAWYWHATEAPGQGDLLADLSVNRIPVKETIPC